jgi:prolyl-tRNA synthetase
LTRVLGTVAEINHDDHGMIWPAAIAPFDIHLIELESKDEQINRRIKETSQKIYAYLQKKQIEVLYDDRAGKSAGEKFKDSDLLGIPGRIVVSAKTLEKNSVELKKRNELEAELIGLDVIDDYKFKG